MVNSLARLSRLTGIGLVLLAMLASARADSAVAVTAGSTIYLPLVFTAPCAVLSMTPTTTFPASSNQVAQTGPNAGTVATFGPNGATAGAYQIYTTPPSGAKSCISCNAPLPGPLPDANKLYPIWHPSGNWIVMVGEIHQHPPYPTTTAGTLEILNGWWQTVYLTTPDGSTWWDLTQYLAPASGQVIGALDPHFTPDGSKLVWTKLVAIPDSRHQFGYWELHEADFNATGQGAPSISNDNVIIPAGIVLSPTGGHWFEPESFTLDGMTALMSSDLNDAGPSYQFGQDIFTINLQTGLSTNLTSSPYVWDEHGHYSPHQSKISYGSSAPYQGVTNPITTDVGLKTELFIMDVDGTNPQQLTHFNVAGYPESSWPDFNSILGEATWTTDGTQLYLGQLLTGKQFPNTNQWLITFAGVCG